MFDEWFLMVFCMTLQIACVMGDMVVLTGSR